MTDTNEYIAFQALDINQLAKMLNDFVTAGGTISTVSISVGTTACALVYGTKPEEE